MGCQGIPLATRGIIFCPQGTVTRITRCVLPFNLRLTTNIFNLNLKKQTTINLNSIINQKKLNLIKLSKFNLNTKISDKFKLNLKKCED